MNDAECEREPGANKCADMFKAIDAAGLPVDHVFTIAVGPSEKKTAARYFVPEPSVLVAALASLVK